MNIKIIILFLMSVSLLPAERRLDHKGLTKASMIFENVSVNFQLINRNVSKIEVVGPFGDVVTIPQKYCNIIQNVDFSTLSLQSNKINNYKVSFSYGKATKRKHGNFKPKVYFSIKENTLNEFTISQAEGEHIVYYQIVKDGDFSEKQFKKFCKTKEVPKGVPFKIIGE